MKFGVGVWEGGNLAENWSGGELHSHTVGIWSGG